MSRIQFITPRRTITLPSGEIKRMNRIVVQSTLDVLRVSESDARERLTPFLRGADYLSDCTDERWPEEFVLWLTSDWPDSGFAIGEHTCSARTLTTNTVRELRSPILGVLDIIRQVPGDRATHMAYIDAPDADWFADTLLQAIAQGVLLQRHRCWQDLVQIAAGVASGAEGPIVAAYSRPGYLKTGDAPGSQTQPKHEWWQPTDNEPWQRAQRSLRASSASYQIAPQVLDYPLAPGLSAFHLPSD